MKFKDVFITGGGGYVGSALVPHLLGKGHNVTAYDLFMYGDTLEDHPNLTKVTADIRDREKVFEYSQSADAIIHLACISNDPSFDLDPEVGKSINYDAFFNILDAAKANDVQRLIVASSTAQYGVKPLDLEVTEDVPSEPITDYAKFKFECENLLNTTDVGDMDYVFVRPATLCGYAPRLRLDLSVNILTIHALENKKIKVFGGSQMRPALNINDMVRFYDLMLEAPREAIHGEAFNVSHSNLTMMEIANLVNRTVGDPEVILEVLPIEDNRSYHVNTDKMKEKLGFECKFSLEDAVDSIVDAFGKGDIVDGLNNPIYHNIKRMQQINLK